MLAALGDRSLFWASCLESPTSPRQALWGCCMPQRAGEGSGARQKPKTNLETDEFASNPPFSKNHLAGVISHGTFGGNDGFKKNWKPGIFKKSFKFRNSCEKTFSNNLVFEPMELSPLPPWVTQRRYGTYPQTHCHRSQMQDFYFYWSLVHRHCPSRPLSTAPLLR